ncbi:MAG: winged helix-turn-helix domain-containing protein [Elusimicrobiota bacterium]|jgi:hypothetical protein|nr:winged helix-turn-helix domain-containing protein [Elusimicrobiota bacterium]
MNDDMRVAIGFAAGDIWNYLSNVASTQKEASFLEIKSALGMSNTMFFLALGWLSRENKISVREVESSYMISIK